MNPPISEEPDWETLLDHFYDRLKNSRDEVRATLRTLVKTACSTVNSAESSLLIPTVERSHLRFFVSVNEALESGSFTVPCDESLAGYVFHTGQMVASDKPEDYYREIDEKVGTRTQEYIAVPILHGMSALGVMTYMNRPQSHPGGAFSETEIEWAQSFASVAAAGLKFYQRMDLQIQLVEGDLERVGRTLNLSPQRPPGMIDDVGDATSQAPIARVLACMEGLDRRDQDFCADVVGMIAERLEGRGGGGRTIGDFRE